MAQLDKNTFEGKFNSSSTGLFKTNTTKDIGSDDMRTMIEDLTDSFINKDDEMLDEDDMSSDSSAAVPTQQSVKAYIGGLIRDAATTGTNTYAATVLNTSKAILLGGNLYMIRFSEASTGASTLNINASGAKKIFINPTTQADSGHLTDEQVYLLIYQTALDGGAGGYLIVGAGSSSGATAAEDVTFTPAGSISATDVQAAVEELDSDVGTVSTGLSNHISDATDAHDATAISFTPAGNIAATNVQAAIEELEDDVVPLTSVSTSTAGGTITLDMNSQIQRMHVGSASFATPKTIAMSNTTGSLVFNLFIEVTDVAAVLTVPASWIMADIHFDGTTWTPPETGKYELGGSFDGTNWWVKIQGPFS